MTTTDDIIQQARERVAALAVKQPNPAPSTSPPSLPNRGGGRLLTQSRQ